MSSPLHVSVLYQNLRQNPLAKVLAESDNGDDEKLSRSKLQRLRNEYLASKKGAVEIWIEDEQR